MTSTELETYEHPASLTLFRTDDPGEVVAHASQTATALAEVVNKQRLYATVSGKKHVLVEGWTLLGSMLGVFPVLDGDPEEVEIAGAHGWRATVKAVTRDGAIVGRASALCLRSESNWKNRDEFALMSMAQTRATSKALRQPLGFVMQLAGFAATPAEEMPRDGDGRIDDAEIITDPDGRRFPDQRDPAPGQFTPPANITDPNLASPAQLKNIGRLMGVLEKQDESGQTTRESLKAEIQLAYGVTSSKELTKKEASEVIDGFMLRAGEK